MSGMGITAADFAAILSDLGVSITYQAYAGNKDEAGGMNYSFAANATKTWIFFKRSSRTDLVKWGISEIGDAYVLMTISDSMNYGDRVVYDSETYEYTADCISSYRKVNGTAMFRYYVLRKVG